MDTESLEGEFWLNLVSDKLKPATIRSRDSGRELGEKLKSLRNTTLAFLFLGNIMWIILLYTVTFPHLSNYGLPEAAFQLLFLAVYGVIILLSFVALLVHRMIMLMHYLGRPQVVESAIGHILTKNPEKKGLV